MKKLLAVVFSGSLLFCGLSVINAASFDTSLSYKYLNGWRYAATARLTETSGSPVTYKQVKGSYNKYDNDSGTYTGFYSFTGPYKNGQYEYTIEVGQGYSMGKVNCNYLAAGTLIDTRTITP